MLQPSVGQPETKARRGITLQQGSERGQNQGMGTPSPTAGMGIQQDPLPAMDRVYASLGLGSAALAGHEGHWEVEVQGDFDVARGQSDKAGGPQTVRPAAQQIPTEVAEPAPKQGCRGSLGWGQSQPPHSAGVSPQPEEPKPPPVEKQTRMKAWESKAPGSRSPWCTHMWPAERPRALTALPTLKHTMGTH